MLEPPCSDVSAISKATQASVGFTLFTPTVNQGWESEAGSVASLFVVWIVVRNAGFSGNSCWKVTFCHDV